MADDLMLRLRFARIDDDLLATAKEAADQLEAQGAALARWDDLRRVCAEIIGADADSWPDHGNAPLAIAATLGLRTADIRHLEAEVARLTRFAARILNASRQFMSDVDGGDVQDFAVEAGLLVPHEVTEQCDGDCRCALETGFPTTCYRYAPRIAEALKGASADLPGGRR